MTWSTLGAGALSLLASAAIGWGITRLGIAIASRRIRRADGLPWIEARGSRTRRGGWSSST